MSKWGNVLSMGAQGAAIGTGINPGLGTIIGAGLGAGAGALMPDSGNEQLQQQGALNAQSHGYNMQMLNAQSDANYNNWMRTNYSAQVREMKKAGLNVGMMYGMGGGGGTTTGNQSGGNYQAQAANDVNREQLGIQRASQAMQLSLLEAQKENIEADTKLKGVNADKTSGVDTDLGRATITNLVQDTKNKEAIEIGIEFDNDLKEIQADVAKRSADFNVRRAEREVQYLESKITEIDQNVSIQAEMRKDIVKLMHENLNKVKADILNTSSNTKLTDAKTSDQEWLNTDDQRDMRNVLLSQEGRKLISEADITEEEARLYLTHGIVPKNGMSQPLTTLGRLWQSGRERSMKGKKPYKNDKGFWVY